MIGMLTRKEPTDEKRMVRVTLFPLDPTSLILSLISFLYFMMWAHYPLSTLVTTVHYHLPYGTILLTSGQERSL